MPKMTKDSWTKSQDQILNELSKQTYGSRSEILEQISMKMPKINPNTALYHALKHTQLKFKMVPRKLEGAALTEAMDLLRTGLDSTAVQNQIHLTHGIYLPTRYYNALRFKSRRGEYTILKDKSGKSYLEHREAAAIQLKYAEGIDQDVARSRLKGKVVSHPTTISVSSNELKDLYTTDRKDLYKITIINMITESLGLEYGSMLNKISNDDLRTKSVQHLLSGLFSDSTITYSGHVVFKKTKTPHYES